MALTKEAILHLKLEGFAEAANAGRAIASSMAAASVASATVGAEAGVLAGGMAAAAVATTATTVAIAASGTALDRVRAAAERTRSSVADAFPSGAIALFGERATTIFARVQAAGEAMAEKLRSAFTAVAFASGGIAAAGYGIFRLLETGERAEHVASSFARLTAPVGGAAVTLDALRAATGGAVDNQTLMLATNKLLIADLGLSREQIAKLAQTAVVMSRVMGTTAASAVRDLSEGIQKQSPMILDNLGITVRSEEALKRYADAHGIAASEIDAATKKQLFLAEVMSALDAAQAKVATGTGVSATATERLSLMWANFSDQFTAFLAAQPGIVAGLMDISRAVIGITEALTPAIRAAADFAGWLSRMHAFTPLLGAIAGFMVGGPIGAAIGAGVGVGGEIGSAMMGGSGASGGSGGASGTSLALTSGTVIALSESSADRIGAAVARAIAPLFAGAAGAPLLGNVFTG